MPELIYDGHVYIAMPPLFKVIPKRGEEQYLYDEKDLERYRRVHTGDFTLQRYKGLVKWMRSSFGRPHWTRSGVY